MSHQSHKNSLFISLLLTVALTALLVLFSWTPLYRGLHSSVTDTQWRLLHHPELADTNIVILALDDKSVRSFSEVFHFDYPWPRMFYGLTLDYFKAAGAKAVIYDVLFTSPEIVRQDIGYSTDTDFAASIAGNGSVILAAMADNVHFSTLEQLAPYKLHFPGGDILPRGEFQGIETPMGIFLNVVRGIGLVNFHTDDDGICRRLPLLFTADSLILPQLAMAGYLAVSGDEITGYDRPVRTLLTANTSFRLDKKGHYPIYWYGPGGPGGVFRYDSFYAVFQAAAQHQQGMAPAIPYSAYKDKIIIVCASAVGLMDLKSTPFTAVSPYPGGEIHATILSNLLHGHRLNEIPFALTLTVTALLIFLLAWFLIERTLLQGIILSLILLAAGITAYLFLFWQRGLGGDTILFAGAIILAATGASMYRVLFEGQAKRQIKTIFTRYLNEDVINLLMEDPEKIDLEGSELVGTVLFTDLQNFTTYSEDKSPKDVIRVLNRYFHIITGAVLEHGGLLDKYTGDGIMAIFGAPLSRADHAKSACEVVLDFRQHNVNELIPTEKGEIATRIGMSSGPFVVGNLGSEQRMDYTAVGDTVNLSARLEGVNKMYGTTNMISEFTWEFVKNDYYFRELDLIRVKGRNRPIRVFTLVDRFENMTKEMLRVESLFRKAMDIYRRRDWEGAILAFETVLEVNPRDKASEAFIERCHLLCEHPALVDEEGVFTFKTK